MFDAFDVLWPSNKSPNNTSPNHTNPNHTNPNTTNIKHTNPNHTNPNTTHRNAHPDHQKKELNKYNTIISLECALALNLTNFDPKVETR